MKKKHKTQALGTGGMGYQLEALAVLAEYWDSVPSIHGGSQLSVTLVLEDPTPSSGFLRHQACMQYTHTTNTGKTLIHIKVNIDKS